MNSPIYNHDFVETEAAKDVDKVLGVPGSSIIVLTGAPGRGKSYIAGHKSAKVWDDLKESGKGFIVNSIAPVLSCSTMTFTSFLQT
ncbi:hypothetical protein EB796_009517 [Bugula neritina]|uniref:Uncharacterized protein n=1 Tax=Bugula neritina TaxID=10212 RepID=A0A7J7K1X9_BUGNE|nr:hypothetical protein EB796_009517 [Bugula neritina]